MIGGNASPALPAAGEPSGSHGRYRPDIDGLRALAVGAVVLFHAGVPYLSGGYVGVDVFFVISGYLITQILLRDPSIGRFYQRRARRILPALFAMLAVVLIAGLCLLLPHDLEEASKSAGATLLFFSNIFFWRRAGYFAVETELWPLLHTWSLGVEEQFYIAFPLIVRLIGRVRRTRIALLFLVLAIASFALAQYGIDNRKTTVVFYNSPTRAWELMIGSILATGVLPPLRAAWLRAAAAALGLAGVLVPVFLYSSATPFPGAGALAPVLGTAFLIWSGEAGTHALTPVLAWEPVRRIGLISYSLYLWHWPILAFARYVAVEPLTPVEAAAALAASMIAAWLSWRYVERPFRAGYSDRAIWWMAAGGMAGLLAVCAIVTALHGVPGRVPPKILTLNTAQGTDWRCPITSLVPFGRSFGCPLNFASGRAEDAQVVLWGDSHAQMYAPALLAEPTTPPTLLVQVSGCAPVSGDAAGVACGEIQRANYALIRALPARVVILAQNWPQTRDEARKRLHRTVLPAERYIDGIRRLEATVAGLRAAGKRVILVAPVAVPGYEMASVVSRDVMFRGHPRTSTGISRAAYLSEYANVLRALDALARDPNVTIVHVDRIACTTARCDYVMDDTPIFADHGHYSADFARRLRPLFAEAVRSANARQ